MKLAKSIVCKYRRGRCQIVQSILEAARDGAIKTRIMEKARLNNGQANSYLTILEKHKFLSVVGMSTSKSVIWRTTDAGLKVIEACEKCHSLLSEIL